MYYKSGDYYQGHFVDGVKHGEGYFQWANTGNNYRGNKYMLYEYELHISIFCTTNTTLTFTRFVLYSIRYILCSSACVGDFEDDFMHGHGTYTFAKERSVYRGVFEFDMRTREGTQTYANGEQL